MTTFQNAQNHRSAFRSIERGLDRMTMDQTARIRRLRKEIEAQDQATYDTRAADSIIRTLKFSLRKH